MAGEKDKKPPEAPLDNLSGAHGVDRGPRDQPKLDKPIQYFDAARRIAVKQAAREKDEADLKAGRVTAEELQRRNAFIPAEWVRQGRFTIVNPMTCEGDFVDPHEDDEEPGIEQFFGMLQTDEPPKSDEELTEAARAGWAGEPRDDYGLNNKDD